MLHFGQGKKSPLPTKKWQPSSATAPTGSATAKAILDYTRYYKSQACFHGGAEPWAAFNAANIEDLKSTQAPDGQWEGQFGSAFSTSASLLSLALNYRFLPIYER